MKGYLNKSQIEYVLYHLNFFLEFDEFIKNRIRFIQNNEDISSCSNQIIFFLIKNELDLSRCVKKNEVVHLFPNDTKMDDFTLKNGNILFNHDLLKASFYLLSGFQELNPQKKDQHDRFPYKESVQNKLGFIDKPMVNYYFQIIIDGIRKFCELHGHKIKIKNPLKKTCFCLSHDIDRIKYYSIPNIKLYSKSILGKNQTVYSKKQLRILLFQNILNYLVPLNDDPYWNFNWLIQIEKSLKIKSSFYFLLDGVKDKDAYFRITDARIRKLIAFLKNNECEIGVHGTVNSYNNQKELNRCIDLITKATNETVLGIRQHYLKFEHPKTFSIQENEKLLYDTTLGFAEHEGFRNSFCHPFKPYDFKNQRMFNIWEIPLLVMDRTLFDYRKLTLSEAQETLHNLYNETKKFNGVFSLLWHNSYFDEITHPGIKDFYQTMLTQIMEQKPNSLTGKRLIELFEKII